MCSMPPIARLRKVMVINKIICPLHPASRPDTPVCGAPGDRKVRVRRIHSSIHNPDPHASASVASCPHIDCPKRNRDVWHRRPSMPELVYFFHKRKLLDFCFLRRRNLFHHYPILHKHQIVSLPAREPWNRIFNLAQVAAMRSF